MSPEDAIHLADILRGAIDAHMALLNPYCLIAQAFYLVVVMRDDKNRHLMFFDKRLYSPFAFLLEHEVADGEHLVHNEDVGNDDGGDGERNARYHAGRIILQGHIEEFLDFREFDDFVEMVFDKALRIAEQGAVQIDVLTRRQLHVEPGTQLDERCDVAVDGARAFGGLEDAGDDLEQSRFAGSVGAEDAEYVSFAHLEGDVVERAEFLEAQLPPGQGDRILLEVVHRLIGHVEYHRDMVDLYHDFFA